MSFPRRLIVAAAVLIAAFLGLCFAIAADRDPCPLTLTAYEDGSGILGCGAGGPVARIDADSGRVSLRPAP